MRNLNIWPGLLVCLGLLFIALTLWSVLRAGARVSGVVDRDYYHQGLHFQDSQGERVAAASRGWRLSVRVVGNQVEAQLGTDHGEPVAGASGELLFLDPSSGLEHAQPFHQIAPGRYRGEIPTGLSGTRQVRLILTRQGARIERRLLLNLPS